MLPILSPILIGAHHPVPHLINKHLYVSALLEDKKGKQAIGFVPVPDSPPPSGEKASEKARPFSSCQAGA